MLVFVSDIHFSDNTAGPPNVPASAFKGAYDSIKDMARSSGAERLEVVFLGDIFDLIRTTNWPADVRARPWGEPDGVWTTAQDAATTAVLNKVAGDNAEALNILATYDFGLPTTRTFIPGNHDRTVNLSDALRTRVVKLLNLNWNPANRFEHWYVNRNARTFARHGHEFDFFNFGGSTSFAPDVWTEIPQSDFDKTPIGDLLAAEVSARIPAEVLARLRPDHPQREALHIELQDLFDVRPTLAMFTFLGYQIRRFDDAQITAAINGGFQAITASFSQLEYIKRWIEERRRWYHPFDKAEALEIVLFLSKKIDLQEIDTGFRLAKWFSTSGQGDNLASAAAADFARLDHSDLFTEDAPAQFILYGHTHDPDQRLINVVKRGDSDLNRIYLNTGMWRPLHNQGTVGGFASWDTLCYSAIYEPGEQYVTGKHAEVPMFEVWTGNLERE